MTFNPNSVAGKGAFFSDPALATVINHPSNTPALLMGNSGVNVLNAYIPGPEVHEGSFAGTNVSRVTLAGTVTDVKAHAFHNMDSLKEVDVTMLGDRIPTADSKAFDNPSDKVLYVLPETQELWEQAPVWNEFQIAGNSTIVEDMTSTDSDIKATRDGNVISLSSNRPLTRVDVYTLDGKILITATPMAFACELSGPELPEVVVVRVADDRNVTAIKLR